MEQLHPARSLIVAVSGGADSMALLHLARRSLPAHQLSIAHFNHQLRAAESDADEAFVREQAAALGLPFHTGRGDVRAAARGISIEMAARQLRHQFLAAAARAASADLILAHHADDQIELFLMRLLRGVQGPGLGGMRSESPSPADPSVRILRPLLNTAKSELLAFLSTAQIPFREDSTNAELHADRNRVRHQIIPPMRAEAGAAFEKNLLAHIAALQHQSARAREAARAFLSATASFDEAPPWLQTEIIALQLEQAGLPVTAARLEELIARKNKPVTLAPGKAFLRDSFGRLQNLSNAPHQAITLDLSAPGQTNFAGLQIAWQFPAHPNLSPREGSMVFDADRVGVTATLRHPQTADHIQLLGRATARPLSEMFSRNKIPRANRSRAIVAATAQNEIFWAEPLRITEPFKVTPATKRFLEWTWSSFPLL
jgi:tRNA(Ile)-lysidine synthase